MNNDNLKHLIKRLYEVADSYTGNISTLQLEAVAVIQRQDDIIKDNVERIDLVNEFLLGDNSTNACKIKDILNN